jgi:hypothetical protein
MSINPAVEVMDALTETMRMSVFFSQPEKTDKKQGGRPHSAEARQYADLKKTLEQMDEFRKTLRSGGTIDLITTVGGNIKTVVTIEEKYLNDPMMADLVDGEFSILGKVIKSLSESGKEPDAINLLRKTTLGRIPRNVLLETLGNINELKSQGFNLPEFSHEILPPAMHVLPVAIYA